MLSDTQDFRGSILLLLSNTQLFPGLGTTYSQQYEEIRGGYAIRKCVRGVDAAYNVQ